MTVHPDRDRRQTSVTTDQVPVTIPTAEVTWSGLTEGETYAWYVVIRGADSGDELAPGEVHQRWCLYRNR